MQAITAPTVDPNAFTAEPVIRPGVSPMRLLVETAPGKYKFPENHPFSLDFNTILYILSFLGKIDLLSVKWTCKLFMAHLVGPRRDRNLIAEAAACGNVPMYRDLSSGKWLTEIRLDEWSISGMHMYNIVDLHISQSYASRVSDDFFAIAGNFFTVCAKDMESFRFSHGAIQLAAMRGLTDVVLFLLDNLTDVGEKVDHRMIVNATMRAGHLDTLLAMINHGKFLAGITFSATNTKPRELIISSGALTEAIRRNHIKMVRWMMEGHMRPSNIANVIDDVSVEMMLLIIEYHFEMSIDFLSAAVRAQRADLVRELMMRNECSDDEVLEAVNGLLKSQPAGTFDKFLEALEIVHSG